MRQLLGSFVIAWSLYSRVPMPQIRWTEERLRYALCFFPCIGVFIGGCVWLFAFFSCRMDMGSLWMGLLGAVLPVFITGGIHMDGFLDATDARRSFLPREEKLRILKDPQAGAFAVIGCCVYFMGYAALFSELDERGILLFAGAFPAERALSGLSVALFPMAKKDGMAASLAQASVKKAVLAAMACFLAASFAYFLAVSAVVFGTVLPGCFCILAAGLVFFWYRQMAVKEFGGITGDLAGYFLQLCEAACLAAAVLAGKWW